MRLIHCTEFIDHLKRCQVNTSTGLTDNKINSEKTKKNSLDALFKTLLSLLMTGKIRVKDIHV